MYQPVSPQRPSLPLLTSTYVAAAAKTRLVTGVTIELLTRPSGGWSGLINIYCLCPCHCHVPPVGVALLAGMITQQDGRKEEKHKGGTD